MSVRRFSEAMGELDNRYIEEALHYRRSGRRIRWGTLAACFCLAVGAVLAAPKLIYSGIGTPQPEYSAGTPQSPSATQPSVVGTVEHQPSSAVITSDEDEAAKHKGENIVIDEAMTMEQARFSQPFGSYLPAEGFYRRNHPAVSG